MPVSMSFSINVVTEDGLATLSHEPTESPPSPPLLLAGPRRLEQSLAQSSRGESNRTSSRARDAIISFLPSSLSFLRIRLANFLWRSSVGSRMARIAFLTRLYRQTVQPKGSSIPPLAHSHVGLATKGTSRYRPVSSFSLGYRDACGKVFHICVSGDVDLVDAILIANPSKYTTPHHRLRPRLPGFP